VAVGGSIGWNRDCVVGVYQAGGPGAVSAQVIAFGAAKAGLTAASVQRRELLL
jgi:hypothetical protein